MTSHMRINRKILKKCVSSIFHCSASIQKFFDLLDALLGTISFMFTVALFNFCLIVLFSHASNKNLLFIKLDIES